MSTRRQFLQHAALGMGLAPMMAAHAAPTPCPPVISGNLWWYHPRSFSLDEWERMLAEQKRLGFDLLWLSNTASALDTEEHGVHLAGLMDQAHSLGFQVLLDTGFTPNWYGHRDLERELAYCGRTVDHLGERFGAHPAFYGWYIPHEIYMTWGDFAAYIDRLYPALVQRAKQAADKPVTLSPFFILDRDQIFGTFQFNEPDAYQRYWEGLLRRSAIDIVMLQDSGEHFSYVTNAMRRPFFQAMHAACKATDAKLWGNVECAEFVCESPEAYIAKYGRVHHAAVKDAPWRIVPMDRMQEKLTLASEYSERIVTWGYQQFGRPVLGEAAQAWGEAYRAYRQQIHQDNAK